MQLKLTVQQRLILSFCVILIIPSLTIGFLSFESANVIVKQQVVQSTEQNMKLLNSEIDTLIVDSKRNIEFLAQTVQIQGDVKADHSPLRQLVNRFQALHPDLVSTYVGTAEGAMIQAPKLKLPADYDPRTREWYKLAMKNKGKVVVTPPYKTASTGDVVVSLSRTTADGRGVVGMNLKLDHLMTMTSDVKIGYQGYAIILDQTGKYIVHPKLERGSTAEGDWTEAVYAKPSGHISYVFDGTPKEMYFISNEQTGWIIIGTMYPEDFAKASEPIFNTTFIVIAVAIVLGAVIIFFIIRSILTPLRRLMRAAHSISEGDLTVQLDDVSRDEIGELSRSFNLMMKSLRSVLNEVSDTSLHLSSSAQELAAASDQSAKASQHTAESMMELAEGSEQQVLTMNEADRTVQEITQGVKSIEGSSHTVAQAAIQSSDVAAEGSHSIQKAIKQMESISSSVHQLRDTMNGLSAHTHSIDDIVKAISAIASQTNLLALNASIEAARAGEHGRGFAVVASEVRKLAEQSSIMARQIAETIQLIQVEMKKSAAHTVTSAAEVELGIEVMSDTGAAFARIEQAVDVVATQIQEVSASAQQMAAGTEQMNGYMHEVKVVTMKMAEGTQSVSATTEEQLASMEEMSTSAEELSRMAERLELQITKFKL
ncbi:methyl-accepting chemotaxis protein [Paenibacillus sp. 481]|uniref:methyl-accepting chemotaxis protein n=1 Tax=Paenibacillus sp. 481 TaxID=2835869 RepID=UPI001E2E8270|nr:methyl-accepting chemotaxis protein [Paenibacillus sp. 481]UHA72796.1 methyl-accepting chemotaxis protein [Paenibacillus sp. 481]